MKPLNFYSEPSVHILGIQKLYPTCQYCQVPPGNPLAATASSILESGIIRSSEELLRSAILTASIALFHSRVIRFVSPGSGGHSQKKAGKIVWPLVLTSAFRLPAPRDVLLDGICSSFFGCKTALLLF